MLKALVVLTIGLLGTPAWALPVDAFVAKGRTVIAIARSQGLTVAERVFSDPKNGFLDLAGPGLHVWATDAHGIVVFDLSGQTSPGTDISHWANDDGTVLMDMIAQRIDSPDGTLISRFHGVPHPKTNQMMDVDFWCGRMPDKAIVCATFWPDAH